MAVKITNIAFGNKFHNSTVDWLLGNVQDDVTIKIDLSIQTFVVASTSVPIILNSTNGFVGDGWIRHRSGGFTGFVIGDTVLFYDKGVVGGNPQTFTILDKLDDSRVRLSGVVLDAGAIPYDPETLHSDCIFSVSTPITALKYQWNFVENAEPNSFNSKISTTTHELVVKDIAADDLTPLPMIFIGEVSYQIGGATAEGVEIDTSTGVYTSKFKIRHTTQIAPLFLTKWWPLIVAGVQPDLFYDKKCLKAIFDIKACTDYTNPNWVQQGSVYETKGNTGGLDENFNTGLTNYTVDSVVYKDAGGAAIPAIALSEEITDVEIHIKNTVDSPFVDGGFIAVGTKFEVRLIKAAYDESEYRLNGRTAEQNFINDRAINELGHGAVSGTNLGVADGQVLTDIVGTLISASEIKITCKIAMLPGVIAVMAESLEPRYILTVAVQNRDLETKKADLVRLNVSALPFYVNYDSPGLIEFQHKYLKHTQGGPDGTDPDFAGEGYANIPLLPEDEVTANTKFFLNKTDYPGDTISIQSIVAKVKVKKSTTGEEVVLDSFPYSFAGLPFINGNQFINFTLPRIFHLPTEEVRKSIKISRRADLDSPNKFAYQVIFPFLNRWETWEKLTLASGQGGDFFDREQPNDGFNNDWKRLSSFADWGFYYELQVIGLRNGHPFTASFVNSLAQYGYDSNPEWNPNTLKSYDSISAVQLYGDGKNWFYSDATTRVQAAFTKRSTLPDLSRIVVNMKLEAYKQGGIAGSRRMSSKWASDADTWFKSIDNSNKVLLSLADFTVPNDTVLADVLIDPAKLPAGTTTYSIAARLYEFVSEIICVCPSGYDKDEETGMCTGSYPSVPGDITYTVGAGNTPVYNGPYAAIVKRLSEYTDENNNVFDIKTDDTPGFPLLNSAYWHTKHGDQIWTTPFNLRTNEWIGISHCLTVAVDSDYIFCCFADDIPRITVDGIVLAVDYSLKDTNPLANPYTRLGTGLGPSLFSMFLKAGDHVVTIEAQDIYAGSAGLFFEVAGPFAAGSCTDAAGETDPAKLYAELGFVGTTPAAYDAKIILRSVDLIGQQFNSGTTSGNTCPDGGQYNECTGLCTINVPCTPQESAFLLSEDGSYVLREDGSRIMLES